MKLLHLLLVILFPCMIFSQNQFVLNDSNIVFINELHYDNVGGDTLEGIEIAALSGTDLSCYKVYFVNGNNGEYYSTITFDTIIPESDCGMGFLFCLKSSIQNGSSTQGDGVALYNVCEDTLGQVVYIEQALSNTSHLNKHLYLSHLEKGLYVLKLSSANKMATRRLILH